jgi:hypothetical protein
MCDGDAELSAHERTGHRRVNIAHDHDPIRTPLVAEPLVSDHYAAGLFGMAATSDSQVMVGIRKLEITEKSLRHVIVVMLSGMDQGYIAPIFLAQNTEQWRDLHKIRSSGSDQMYEGARHIISWPTFRLYLLAKSVSN